MRFFKMPNQIFNYGLSPKAVFTYAFLLSRKNALSAVIASYENISVNCHMDEKTAARAINELLQKKLIVKETRHDYRGKLKNKYLVYGLPGGWFKAEYQLFQTQIKSTDFLVYCYIKKCMDSKCLESFPSLNAITKGTGLSHSRVVASVQYLRNYTFINQVKRHYKRTKAFRHNRYLLFKLKKKKKTRLLERVFKKLKNLATFLSSFKVIVKQEGENVNHFLQESG